MSQRMGGNMTADKQLLEQALEALEYYQHRNIEWEDFDEQVITAIRERLANAGARLQSRSDVEQPEQEPIAWIERDMECDDFDPDSVTCKKPDIAAEGWEWVPLVLAPTPPAAPVKEQNEALQLAMDWYDNGNEDREEFKAMMEILLASTAAPVQEPVAWGMQNDDGEIYDCITPKQHAADEGEYTVPLYTTPPNVATSLAAPAPKERKRQSARSAWVGLTDEEYEKAIRDNMLLQMNFAGIRDDIEAKLKEKNT